MATKPYCCIARQDGYQCDCELVMQTSNQLLKVISTMAEFISADHRVRELHRPDPSANGYCDECQTNYPCPTIEVLDGEQS